MNALERLEGVCIWVSSCLEGGVREICIEGGLRYGDWPVYKIIGSE